MSARWFVDASLARMSLWHYGLSRIAATDRTTKSLQLGAGVDCLSQGHSAA
jgi:hypothetical protein